MCDAGSPKHMQSGRHDGADWDNPEAYVGGALPDWSQPDPAITGKAAGTVPFNGLPK